VLKITFCPKDRPLYSPNRARGQLTPWPTARSASGSYLKRPESIIFLGPIKSTLKASSSTTRSYRHLLIGNIVIFSGPIVIFLYRSCFHPLRSYRHLLTSYGYRYKASSLYSIV